MFHAAPIIINDTYSSLESLAVDAKRWSLDFKKLSSGPFKGYLKLIDMGDIQLGEIKMNGTILQNGTTPSNYKTIIIAGDEMQFFKWQNYSINSGVLMMAPLNNEFSAITHRNFHVYTLSIHNDYFEQMMTEQDFTSLREYFGEKASLCPINKNELLKLNSYLKVVFDEYITRDVEYDLSLKATLDNLLLLLLNHLNKNKADLPNVKFRKVDEAVHKFCDTYNVEPVPDISVKDFCERNNIKQKTLEKGINEYFDISPIALIKALRLNCFRRKLFYHLRSVSDAAEKCGISHLGQLSADYKKLFGERPSDTIKALRLMSHQF